MLADSFQERQPVFESNSLVMTRIPLYAMNSRERLQSKLTVSHAYETIYDNAL